MVDNVKNMKYKLTDESVIRNGVEVFRIESLQDLPHHGVKKGELGGFIASKDNLTTNLNDPSWVSGQAIVYGDSVIQGASLVEGRSVVYDSNIAKNSRVSDSIVKESSVYETTITNGSRATKSNVGNASVDHYSEVICSIINHSKVKDSASVYSSKVFASHIDDERVAESNLNAYQSGSSFQDDLDDLALWGNGLAKGQ